MPPLNFFKCSKSFLIEIYRKITEIYGSHVMSRKSVLAVLCTTVNLDRKSVEDQGDKWWSINKWHVRRRNRYGGQRTVVIELDDSKFEKWPHELIC